MLENAKISTFRFAALVFAVAALLSLTTGCETATQPHYADASELAAAAATHTDDVHTESIILRDGDKLKITFPGAPNLNSDVQIMRDGNITMPLI
ncbi:MAG TPA: polysaccharide biosynthesis/export family protein, partial [Candidatus Saccharimonadales bacterium]|nr:polysaccharide biosynthesis/export family protein [Candidatus Saccharimonadales bacterium]